MTNGEALPEQIRTDLGEILCYGIDYTIERADFLAGPDERHIYLRAQRLEAWLAAPHGTTPAFTTAAELVASLTQGGE